MLDTGLSDWEQQMEVQGAITEKLENLADESANIAERTGLQIQDMVGSLPSGDHSEEGWMSVALHLLAQSGKQAQQVAEFVQPVLEFLRKLKRAEAVLGAYLAFAGSFAALEKPIDYAKLFDETAKIRISSQMKEGRDSLAQLRLALQKPVEIRDATIRSLIEDLRNKCYRFIPFDPFSLSISELAKKGREHAGLERQGKKWPDAVFTQAMGYLVKHPDSIFSRHGLSIYGFQKKYGAGIGMLDPSEMPNEDMVRDESFQKLAQLIGITPDRIIDHPGA